LAPVTELGATFAVTWNTAPNYYITVPVSGKWRMSGDVWFDAAANGERNVYFDMPRYAGREIGKQRVTTSTDWGCSFASEVYLVAGDTIQCKIYFNGAAAINIAGNVSFKKMEFMLTLSGGG